jgi:AraC-like DNA-binding protein
MDIGALICYSFTCAGFFLLAFIAFFNPVKINITANRWFGVFLFSLGCLVLNAIIFQFGDAAKYSRLIAFNELSRFAMAPALYLSVAHFTSPDKTFNKKNYLHFIPFAIFFVLVAPSIFGPAIHFLPRKMPGVVGPILSQLVFLSVKVQLILYWILSYYRLNQHQKNIRLINSTIKPINLNWLKYLLLGIVFMILLWLNELFLHVGFVSILAPYGYVAGVFFISYFLLAQKEIYPFEDAVLADIDLIINNDTTVKYAKQRLTDEQLAQLKTQVILLMEEEKLYLDNELSLPQLAKKMAISSHDLSYVLNQGFNKKFFQFVNAYRVEQAKQLMLSDKHKHLNLLGIAYSSGFNSKTTFNISFKKETDLSPTQFIQQVKNSRTTPAMR